MSTSALPWNVWPIYLNSPDFSCSPVFRTPCFHCRGMDSILGWETKISHAKKHCQRKKKKCPPLFILPVKSSLFKEKWRRLGGRWQRKPKIIQRSKFFPFASQRKSWGWPEHLLLPKTWPISHFLGKMKILKNPTEKSVASLNAEKLFAFPPKDKIKFFRVSYDY